MSTEEGERPRFPRKGDQLFPPVEDWDVEIPRTPEGRAEYMIYGYKRAADELVQIAIDKPEIKPALVYPIMYCYRQFIELSLKVQLRKFSSAAGLSSEKFMKSHDLRKLLRQYLKLDKDKSSNALTQTDMYVFIGCIKEFDRIDPRSFVFRYPDGQNGEANFMSTNKIDLENIRDVMHGLGNLLMVADDELDNMLTKEI